MYRLFDVCKRTEASKTGLRGWNVPASTTAALCNKLGSNCPSCACRLGTWGNQVRGSLRMNQDGNRQGLTEDAPQSSDAFGQKNRLLSNFAGRHIAPIFGADKSSRGSDGARALFGDIGSQPGASSACKRCSGEPPREALGCLGWQIYILHNDLDDLVGVVLRLWRV